MYRVKTYDRNGKLIQTYCSYNRDTLETYVRWVLFTLRVGKRMKTMDKQEFYDWIYNGDAAFDAIEDLGDGNFAVYFCDIEEGDEYHNDLIKEIDDAVWLDKNPTDYDIEDDDSYLLSLANGGKTYSK